MDQTLSQSTQKSNLPKITIMNLEKGFLLKRKTKKQLLLASFNETSKFTTNNILTKDYWAFANAQMKTDGDMIITLKTIFSFYVLTHTAASVFNNRAILL